MKTRIPSAHSSFRQVTIVGVGLIGGSLGLAIRQRFPRVRVVGCDTREVLQRALRRKAINAGEPKLDHAVRDADLVLLATPISSILHLLSKISRALKPDAIVSDVGSIKAVIVREANRYFPQGNFIGGHPMTGIELSGIDAAHPLLFENAVYVLTPTHDTRARFTARLGAFLSTLGARVVKLDATAHDEIAAAISHVPQLISVALMNAVGKRHPSARRHLQLAAGGFRDLTRIASSRFDIWQDILPLNEKEIRRSLSLFARELEDIARALKGKDVSKLSARFRTARKLRNAIPKNMKGFMHPLADVFVFVKDQPGMLSKMTNALTKAKINIKDIELMKIREGTGGTFRLSFDSNVTAEEAGNVLKRAGFELSR